MAQRSGSKLGLGLFSATKADPAPLESVYPMLVERESATHSVFAGSSTGFVKQQRPDTDESLNSTHFGDLAPQLSRKSGYETLSSSADDAPSDHGGSVVWNSVAKLLHIPALQTGPVDGPAQKALVSYSVQFGKSADSQDTPMVDFDAAFARAAGGTSGKGRVKPVTDPVIDSPEPTPAPAPAPTPTGPATYDFLSGQDTPNGFNIGLIFSGTGWTDALKLGFKQAAEYLSDIIVGDVAAVTTTTGVVDDIRIKVSLTALDGTGGLGGWGEYTSVRSGSYLPSEGSVKMDSADSANWLAKGIWDDFALHEMLHCLGFGTGWKSMGLVQDFSGDLRFTGDNATAMYNKLYPLLAGPDLLSDFGVPVETDGGTGTAGVHWDDTTFKNEIMTGTLNYTNVVSDMTIAALEDMGYNTIYVPDLF